MLKEALLKAGVVNSDDVARVERQQRIKVEEERKRKARSEERRLIDSFHPNIRNAIKHLRKNKPKVITKAILEKLAAAKGRPWLLADPEILEAMSHITVESIRQDFQKMKDDGTIDKLAEDVKSGKVKTIVVDSVSTQEGSNGKMRKMQS
jgi:hypothetical protein